MKPVAVSIDTTTFTRYHSITPQKEDEEDLLFMAQNIIKNNEIVPKKVSDEVVADERQLLGIKYGHAKNHRNDLWQIIAGVAVEVESGLSLLLVTRSWDACDKITFSEMVENVLSSNQELSQSIKYLVGDSALCTEASFKVALKHGNHIVTRVPDNFKVTKELLNSDSLLTPVEQDGEKSAQLAVLLKYSEMFGIPVNLLLV